MVTGEQEEGYSVPNASTATRTDTPLRDIPQSIQVIPRQVIEEQQVIRLDEALRNVSGVTFGGTNEGTGTFVDIRGFQGDLDNSFELDNYFLTNAAIFYRRDNWRVALNFKHIFDIDYSSGTPFGNTRIGVGEPFTAIGSVSVEF